MKSDKHLGKVSEWNDQIRRETVLQKKLLYKIQLQVQKNWYLARRQYKEQETQLLLTNRATSLEVSQGHQTSYHSKF